MPPSSQAWRAGVSLQAPVHPLLSLPRQKPLGAQLQASSVSPPTPTPGSLKHPVLPWALRFRLQALWSWLVTRRCTSRVFLFHSKSSSRCRCSSVTLGTVACPLCLQLHPMTRSRFQHLWCLQVSLSSFAAHHTSHRSWGLCLYKS